MSDKYKHLFYFVLYVKSSATTPAENITELSKDRFKAKYK